MTRQRGRVLIVEDDPKWLELFDELLHELGLEVVTASDYESAIELLDNQYFHLAVIDLRLEGDDLENTQGMDILSHIDQIGLGDVVAKIIITGFGTRDRVRKSFKQYNVHDFISKRGPENKGFDDDDFIRNVESAFIEKVKINSDLDIEFVHGLSLDELASQVMQADDKDQIEMVRWELDDLMRKLFPDAQSLTVSRVSGGYSKAKVVMVEPFYAGKGQAEALIVKYGPVDEIETEASNFDEYVKRFTVGRRHTNLEGQARTRSLGGIVYSLVGKARSFGEFYPNNQVDDICLVLDDLFGRNCSKWYENRSQKRTRNLSDLYWQPVGATREKLLQSVHQMYPRFKDQQRIVFPKIEGKFINPVYHDFTTDKPIYLPVYTAITHGDLHGDNFFVDQDKRTWMIDFFRTGEGHISRDFVMLEAVIKFQLLEETSLGALYEFEKAILAPDSFTDEFVPPQAPMSSEMSKAFAVIKHLRGLAGKVIQPSHDIHAYYGGLFYHTLNLIRYYYLLQLKRRKYYILLSAAMLCDKLERLITR